MPFETSPEVTVQMLIRKPVAEVYRAFVDPAITTRFWFTHASGALEPGARVEWRWAMYGASTQVTVKELVPRERLRIEWGEPVQPVEWVFDDRGDATLVTVTSSRFTGTDDEILAKALDQQGGFSFLLAAAKAWLEHGIELHLVRDHYPDAHVD